MIGFLKVLAPAIVYFGGIFMILLALSGRTKYPLMLLIAAIPLRNVIEKLHRYPLGKDLIDIMFFALLIGTVVYAVRNKHRLFEKSPINGVVCAMIFYTFISVLMGSAYLYYSSLFSPGDPRVQAWKNFCLLPVLYYLVLVNIRDRAWIWKTILVMCAAMVLMDYYTFQQVLWFTNLESRAKIHGTFAYLGPNEVAAFYNMYTSVLLALFFYIKEKKWKMALLGLIYVNVFCIFFLFSRAAYLGLACGLFILFALKQRLLLVPLIIIGIFWQVILPEKVITRIMQTHGDYGELDKSAQSRLDMWEYSLELFSDNPVMGIGYGTFSHMGFELGDTHNIYMKILAEQGLIGVVIFLILLMLFFMLGIRLMNSGKDGLSQGLGLGFAVCIVVLAVNNVFGDRWTYMEVSSNMWVFAALVTRLIILNREGGSEADWAQNVPSPEISRMHRLTRKVARLEKSLRKGPYR